MTLTTYATAAFSIAVVVALILFFMRRRSSGDRAYRRRQYGTREEEPPSQPSPWIPDWLEEDPRRVVVLTIVILVVVVTLFGCLHAVPAGYRGVLLTFGRVEDRILQEGLNFKMPFIQSVVRMNVQIQKAESSESTASKDLQEVSTTVAVNYRIDPKKVNEIYRKLRKEYAERVIKPNIEESLKAATATFTAEELITKREMMKAAFGDILDDRLATFHIEVVAVSLTDFQFSQSFNDAIEAKVTAEQAALEAKNKLKQIEYEAQQQIIQAEAARNATIARALGEAEAVRIVADGDAYATERAGNATAAVMSVITAQMTPEYAHYLYLKQWSGLFPTTMLGDIEDLGLIIDTTP